MRNLVRHPCLAVLAIGAPVACPRSGLAAATPPVGFEELARAWMGTVAFLADADDDERGERGSMKRGDRCECGDGDCEKCRGGREHGHHARGERHHGGHGGMEGPRAVMTKMDDILARLSRIEAKLDGRAGGPPRGEWRGPRPPMGGRGPGGEMPEQVRRMMEERMREAREKMSPEERERFDARMKAMRERMGDGGPRPEGRPERGPEGMPAAEAREEMRKRMMEEGRERMEQARRRFGEMEERIKKLEAEIERLKADR